jgi:hypothetical protein
MVQKNMQGFAVPDGKAALLTPQSLQSCYADAKTYSARYEVEHPEETETSKQKHEKIVPVLESIREEQVQSNNQSHGYHTYGKQ